MIFSLKNCPDLQLKKQGYGIALGYRSKMDVETHLVASLLGYL